jgi:hypothetical protein
MERGVIMIGKEKYISDMDQDSTEPDIEFVQSADQSEECTVQKDINKFCMKCGSPIETYLKHPKNGYIAICVNGHAESIN